jgi:dihydrofolate synthase/folylpolyglutamate synthase
MGHPERDFASVHIAGTNGKGSIASMIAAIGQSAGYRIGLYTSPHLLHLSERIRLNGIPVSDTWMLGALDRYGSLFDRLQPSFFEALTALAFLFFAESSVDLAVVETGLGGRLDATNILKPKLSVISQIDWDHTQVLGNSLTSIAREKAGIIKDDTPVVAATGQASTQQVVRETASNLNAPWIEPGIAADTYLRTPLRTYDLHAYSLAGEHQTRNALLATRSAEFLFPETRQDPSLILKGLERVCELTGLRARLEVFNQNPLAILDVAHNPAGVAAALNYMPRDGAIHLLLSLMKDKELDGVMRVLRGHSLKVYACDLALQRAMSASDLVRLLKDYGIDVAGTGSVSAMWNLAIGRVTQPDSILVCGSHFLAGAFLGTVHL